MADDLEKEVNDGIGLSDKVKALTQEMLHMRNEHMREMERVRMDCELEDMEKRKGEREPLVQEFVQGFRRLVHQLVDDEVESEYTGEEITIKSKYAFKIKYENAVPDIDQTAKPQIGEVKEVTPEKKHSDGNYEAKSTEKHAISIAHDEPPVKKSKAFHNETRSWKPCSANTLQDQDPTDTIDADWYFLNKTTLESTDGHFCKGLKIDLAKLEELRVELYKLAKATLLFTAWVGGYNSYKGIGVLCTTQIMKEYPGKEVFESLENEKWVQHTLSFLLRKAMNQQEEKMPR